MSDDQNIAWDDEPAKVAWDAPKADIAWDQPAATEQPETPPPDNRSAWQRLNDYSSALRAGVGSAAQSVHGGLMGYVGELGNLTGFGVTNENNAEPGDILRKYGEDVSQNAALAMGEARKELLPKPQGIEWANPLKSLPYLTQEAAVGAVPLGEVIASGAAAPVTMALQSAGQKYAEARQASEPPSQAFNVATAEGGVSGALGTLPIGIAAETAAPVKRIVGTSLGMAGVGAGQTAADIAIEQDLEGRQPESIGSKLARIAEAGAGGLIPGGVIGAAVRPTTPAGLGASAAEADLAAARLRRPFQREPAPAPIPEPIVQPVAPEAAQEAVSAVPVESPNGPVLRPAEGQPQEQVELPGVRPLDQGAGEPAAARPAEAPQAEQPQPLIHVVDTPDQVPEGARIAGSASPRTEYGFMGDEAKSLYDLMSHAEAAGVPYDRLGALPQDVPLEQTAANLEALIREHAQSGRSQAEVPESVRSGVPPAGPTIEGGPSPAEGGVGTDVSGTDQAIGQGAEVANAGNHSVEKLAGNPPATGPELGAAAAVGADRAGGRAVPSEPVADVGAGTGTRDAGPGEPVPVPRAGAAEGLVHQPELSSIANRVVDAERAAKGLDEVHYDGMQDDAQAWGAAREKLSKDQRYGDVLAADLIAHPRAPSKEENAALAQHQAYLKSEHRQQMDEIASAMESGDRTAEAFGRARLAEIERLYEQNHQAARVSGAESSASLRTRQLMSREDFSMAHMLTEFKVKYGRDAKPEERAKLEDISKQVEELDKRIAALEQAKPTSKPFARGKVQRGSDAEFNNLAAKLKEISQRDPRGHCEI